MPKILDNIHSPDDLMFLSPDEIRQLCEELRTFLVENVSKTGGHLASNLGVVEMTVAMHRVFDSPNDKIIFDVGHQSYVHKILTGRREAFSTLRTVGGLSGFTSMRESEHDPFGAGHSSTALSAALGIAEANKLLGSDAYTICVMGDGAYTGGMVHEALNNTKKDLKLIIILNENRMSISRNRGNFSSYLSKVRVSKKYNSFKVKVKRTLSKIPLVGKPIVSLMSATRSFLRGTVYPMSYFEMLGIDYIGVINGHDEVALEKALRLAKSLDKTVIIHIKTKKGKGYEPAEKSPDLFHSVYQTADESDNFHSVFASDLISMAKTDERIVAVTAAMGIGTGLQAFGEKYNSRYFDVGIAEAHALTFSAGLCARGLRPYTVIYSTFLQRAYDNILHDVALQNLPVRIIIDRAGLSPHDGATHHGIFDVAFLSHIPDIEIYAPITYPSLHQVLENTKETPSPVAIRYPNQKQSDRIVSTFFADGNFSMSPARISVDCENENLIITYGAITLGCLDARDMLNSDGEHVDIILLEQLKPYDKVVEFILPHLRGKKKVLFVEEGIYYGGAGMILHEKLSSMGALDGIQSRVFAIDDNFAQPATPCDIYDYLGLSPMHIKNYFTIEEKENE